MNGRIRFEFRGYLAAAAIASLAALSFGCAPDGARDRGTGGPLGGELAGSDAIVLLSIDTFTAERVGCYGTPNVRTPVIDRLARSGILVRDAISPAPLTLPSHATILTGLDPPAHGVRDNGLFTLNDSLRTLAELLPADVRKAAFVSGFPVHSRFNLDQGFDLYDEVFEDRKGPGQAPERSAAAVFTAAAAWLEAEPPGTRPFAWIHSFDPHEPYEAPGLWPDIAKALGAGPYEGEIAYTDHELGVFLRRIAAFDRDRQAVILLTADHGESRGAHKELSHSIFVYDITQRVPLILAGPGISPRLETSQRRLVDVAPTVLDLHGIEPAEEHEGDSILGATSILEAYVENKETELMRGWSALYGIRTREWKYIRAPRPELYDLRADPGEIRNVHGAHPDIEARLDALVQEILDRSVGSELHPMDPSTAERLHALGYIASIEPGTATGGGKDPKDGIDGVLATARGARAFQAGDLASAERNLRRAIQIDPEGKEAYSYLAGTYFATGRYGLAAEYARRALDLAPHVNEGPILETLGESLLRLDRPRDALVHLERAAEMQPRNRRLSDLVRQVKANLP